MKYIFNLMTTISLRFRLLTVLLVIALLVLGGVAASQLNQELLPPIEFPQTIILAQTSGMTSDEVLTVLTERLEPAIDSVEDIINLESQTTGAFGVVITAYNDFGLDSQRLQRQIRDAIDTVWLPTRTIAPPEGEDEQAFAADLLNDLTADILIYLAQQDLNFLFQLSPETWEMFSDETIRTTLAYLANQEERNNAGGSALERLVEAEIVPQLQSIDRVARVAVEGGQVLPGEEADFEAVEVLDGERTESQLLRLSPEVWNVVSSRLDLGALDQEAVETLQGESFEIPEQPPALPESWQQFDHFNDSTDLIEVETLTSPVAEILNDFLQNSVIRGALGQTDDLSPETVTRLLEIEPSMVQYFEAEHLVAMSPEVFAALPEEFVSSLDGFTRDELAAAALAQSITGEDAVREPVDLPDAWRIRPPELITFSFADLPLATFSVFSVGEPADESLQAPATDETTGADEPGEAATTQNDSAQTDGGDTELPEGPALPPLFAGVGADTADDLINFELPESIASLIGVDSLPAAEILNTMADPPDLTQAGGSSGEGQTPSFSLDMVAFGALVNGGRNIIPQISADAIQFLIENDPDFLSSLQPAVFDLFSDEVLALPQVSPPLDDAWNVLSSQPQFADNPLETAADVLTIGDGEASSVLNTINTNVPDQFEGYEVRLFDSLTPAVTRYFRLEEPDFYENLDTSVLLKLSPEVLAQLPESFVESLDNDVAAQVTAIASGEEDSAFAALQALYATDIAEADPDAPALNAAWSQIAGFYGIELDTADDFFRFPDGFTYSNAGDFINSIFASPQGAGFARNNNLIGGMPIESLQYVVDRDASVLDTLSTEVLSLMTAEQLATLPGSLQQRAAEGGDVFTPERQVTRTDQQPSLFVTVFKDTEANTVSTYHEVEDLVLEISEGNPDIEVGIVFEQSSFIEESISGVAREGGLGAVFAVIIILIFLSSGSWKLSWRRRTGMVMIMLFTALLVLLIFSGLDAAGNDWGQAFYDTDVVFRVLLIGGIIAGFLVLLWPGNLPDPAWRATIVISISIPLSILTALVGMRWLSPFMFGIVQPLAENSDFFAFILRLFPEELTLNIMTLSGLTVAVGRVVDDSIVVLENIFRQIEMGGNKREAVISGTRDVSAAIFVATLVAVVVFLPLGLTGGIIGAFFLPFGLAVTYALLGSFIVAVTVVPVLAYVFIDSDDVAEEGDIWLARYYLPVLRWGLSSWFSRFAVLAIAILSFLVGGYLFGQRPAAFLPDFGEPQITINIEMPSSTKIVELNEYVEAMETFIVEEVPDERLRAIQTIVGGGGQSFETLLTGNSVSENRASITVGVHFDGRQLDEWTRRIREQAGSIFGQENVVVSSGSLSSGGFGGLSLIVSGPPDVLTELDPLIIATIESVEGITNVSSNLSEAASGDDGPVTYIRVNQQSALSYTAELETEDAIGVTQAAIAELEALDDLPDTVTISQGFISETQTEGFASLFIAMGIASVIVILVLVVTFSSPVYWLAIFLSVIVAPVGAAVALTLTDRVLGISALIGLLMLLGLVITNAVVLIDRVRSNLSERHMPLYDALIEAGGRRLRPILMTSLATIIALIPLAIGLSEGAIIAAEMGTVVIGGVVSSTLLTLIVVPVMYSLLTPVHRFFARLVGVETAD